jgi:hypothetical protein
MSCKPEESQKTFYYLSQLHTNPIEGYAARAVGINIKGKGR